MTLPNFTYDAPAEAWADADVAAGCLPGVEQPGVRFFQRFVQDHVGGGSFGISSCDRGYVSDHFEGRAWDWALDARDPEDAARAAEVLVWLLADDWEVFRRLGLKYVIWNDRIYSRGQSHAYVGSCEHCVNPHTDHMHLSFSWRGARGETSWFRAAGFGGAAPTLRPPAAPTGATGPSTGSRVAAFVVAGAAAYGIARMLS